jgi:ribosomal-protein-alanine N-acetyltransferase
MIETAQLCLCRPTSHDISTLENLWRNAKVRNFLGGTVSDDIIQQKIIAIQTHWDLHQFGQWAVFEKRSKQLIGLCGLHYSDEGIELSYMFFPKFWGKGFASEAVKACVDYGFNSLEIKSILAITQAANIKSCQLLNKIGMKHIKNFERFNATQCFFELTSSKELIALYHEKA